MLQEIITMKIKVKNIRTGKYFKTHLVNVNYKITFNILDVINACMKIICIKHINL